MTIIYFILVLGVTVFIHELGHFIFAKKAGIYIYEFSIGMGPKIFSFNRKNDETTYTIRLFPIGGFVQMAGEQIEEDEDIPAEKNMQSKTWFERFLTIIAGITFNFIFALVLLFIIGLINGAPINEPRILSIDEELPIAITNIQPGDVITKIGGKSIKSVDRLMLELQFNYGDDLLLELKDSYGTKTVLIKPVKVEEDGKDVYRYGFSLDTSINRGVFSSIKYAFQKTYNLLEQMVIIIWSLITGKIGLDSMAGPIGIFNVVGETAKAGLLNLVYLTAFLSINVGFINLLPIPAFDGGRLLFLAIEKINGKPINPKTENIIHSIGFVFLMILMVVITYNDILRLFK